MAKFVAALEETKFILPVVKSIEIFSGVLLLIGIWIPFAIALLAPVIFVIVSSQLILNYRLGFSPAFFCGVPYSILVVLHSEKFAFLFR